MLRVQYYIQVNWRPPRKSGLTPKSTKTRVVRYAIIKSSQWFTNLTHTSSEASISYMILWVLILKMNWNCIVFIGILCQIVNLYYPYLNITHLYIPLSLLHSFNVAYNIFSVDYNRWTSGIYDWQNNQWVKGDTGEPLTYWGFITQRPPHSWKWYCIYMAPNLYYRWNHDLCTKKMHFICETSFVKSENNEE